MNKTNIPLVLEGGGSKCAYQIGALIALEEKGFSFNVLSGASFGALNAALYIEGGTQRMIQVFENMNVKELIYDEELCNYINNYAGDGSDFLTGITAIFKKKENVIELRDKVTSYYHNYLRTVLNVKAIKESDKDFYCSVLRINNNPITMGKLLLYFQEKADILPLYLSNEIEGRIIDKCNDKLEDYIIASANYPTYSPLKIDEEYFYDGGIYDNAPYKHLLYKGYKDMVIIRTHPEPLKDIEENDPHILVIRPKNNLGHALHLTHKRIMNLISLGYKETKEYLENNKDL